MKKFNILGDSHTEYFKISPILKFELSVLEDVDADIEVIHGASIIGLGKRQSTLSVNKLIEDKVTDDSYNVLCFGQVDLELGYYYRKIVKKENITSKEYIAMLVQTYFDFILSLKISHDSIVVKGVNLTTLKHPHFSMSYVARIIIENIEKKDQAPYMKHLRKIYDSESIRNEMLLEFNSILSIRLSKVGIKYFDINDLIANSGENKSGSF